MVAIMPQHVKQNVTRAWLIAGLVTTGMGAAQATDIQLQTAPVEQGLFYAELHAATAEHWNAPLRHISGGLEELVFTDVPPGRYAVQLFVDLNGNGQLDLSLRGIPREPVGFSGNARLSRGKPGPQGCAFEHDDGGSLVQIKLHRGGSNHPLE